MRSIFSSLTLAVSIMGAVIAAACGEATPAPQTPANVTAEPSASPTEAAPAASTAAPHADHPTTMPPITASKLGDELKAIGLDINNLPVMSKLKAAERSKVMPILVKAVGIECKGCHVEENGKLDYKASTRKKDITVHMWDEYVVNMKLSAGGALFCDSCHQGEKHILSKDRDAVQKYMDENYVNKLDSKNGSTQSCATCHTEDFEMNIFDKVWKVQPKKPKAAEISPASDDRQVLGLR